MSLNWSITNGDGTIGYSGMLETAARRVAAELAEKHGEVFYVAEGGRAYPEAAPHLGLGEPVSPDGDGTKRLEYVPEAAAAGFGGPWLVTIRTGEQAEHAPARTGPTDGVTSGPVPLTSYQQGYPTREAAMAAHPGLREPATTTPRVMDANTGDVLPGRPSPELVEASLAVPHTGAVGASQDAEGVWQFVRPEDARPNTRTVWIQE